MNEQTKINRGEIQHIIIELKKEFPELKKVYSKTLQYECYRLFSNLSSLTQRKKRGHKVGKLRFKGKDWFKTINYNQSGYKLIQTGKRFCKLKLSKIGSINIRCHRKIQGKLKHISIKKSTGKWFVSIVTDGAHRLKKGTGKVGLDLGIINFVADNRGNKIKSPLHLKKSLKKIRITHKEVSRKKLGSNNRYKSKQKLSSLYEKITNQRNDFLHKLSSKVVSENKLICIENLSVSKMVTKDKYWNKRNMLDCSWGKFAFLLKYKAENAGAVFIEVNPKNTTKKCSNCGELQDFGLQTRTYVCDCGLVLDHDVNAAKNILAQGLGFVENYKCDSMKQEAITSTLTSVRI